MLTYTLEKGRGQSLYESLYQKIRADIVDGNLKAGDKLPSKRALAANLGISVVTVESAYAQLVAEGYAEARPRRGVFVCAIGRQLPCPAAQPEPPEPSKPAPVLLDLSGGGGEDVPFPFSVWAKTLREVIATQGKRLMEPVPFGGAPELRQAIAAHLYQTRGLRVSPEQIVVGAGNEYFYGLIVQLLGRAPRYAVEDPGYQKIAGIYRANDVTVCPVELDREGLSVRALRQSGAQIAHISPAHHFPTGIVMPIRRRNELLAWAYEQPERYILEDDYDSELRHSGKPVPPLFSLDGRQRVIYLSTFTQTISPALRVAYLCLPPRLLARLRQRLGFYACTVPSFEQYALAHFIASGDYERHVNRLRKRFRRQAGGNLQRHRGQPAPGPVRHCGGKRRDPFSAAARHLPLRPSAEGPCRSAWPFHSLSQRLPLGRRQQRLSGVQLRLSLHRCASPSAGNPGRAAIGKLCGVIFASFPDVLHFFSAKRAAGTFSVEFCGEI